jgi:WXG100 family type VII secretion target
MNTDAAVLAKEAGNFDRISGELKAIVGQIEATAGALASHLQGGAGLAAQSAIQRFTEAGNQQIMQLTDISNNIHTSGVQYTSTDDDQASALQQAMGSVL